jgi:hypothetical protein
MRNSIVFTMNFPKPLRVICYVLAAAIILAHHGPSMCLVGVTAHMGFEPMWLIDHGGIRQQPNVRLLDGKELNLEQPFCYVRSLPTWPSR